MPWRPDLLTLKLFIAVCEERSFSRAADREAMVVSAVSKRISEFEDAAGIQLLQRHAKGVELTDAGRTALARARQILAATDLLQEDLQGLAQGDRGHVRILAAVSAGVESFSTDMADFLRDHGQISVEIEERMAPEIIDGVRSGEADLGLGFASAAALDLHQTPYAVNNLALFAGPGHPLHAREGVRFTDLLAADLVALRATSGTTLLLSSLAARESKTLNYRAFTSSLETAFRIISDGAAVGVLGEHAGLALQRWYGVRPVPILEDWALRQVVLYTRESQPASPPTRKLVAYLASRASADVPP